MDKYIRFDIDSKKTIACVVQKGKKDMYTTLKTDIEQMKNFLQKQRQAPVHRIASAFFEGPAMTRRLPTWQGNKGRWQA